MEFSFGEVLILFIGVYLLFSIIRLEGQVKGLKHSVDYLIKHADLPEKPLNNEVRQLLNEGEDVKAVKKVRETLGLSLIEAKQYVDALKLKGE